MVIWVQILQNETKRIMCSKAASRDIGTVLPIRIEITPYKKSIRMQIHFCLLINRFILNHISH